MHTLLARPSKHQTEKQITAHTVGLHSLLGTPLLYCIITEQVVVNLICLTFNKDVSLESSKRKVYCNKRREKEHSEWWHISLQCANMAATVFLWKSALLGFKVEEQVFALTERSWLQLCFFCLGKKLYKWYKCLSGWQVNPVTPTGYCFLLIHSLKPRGNTYNYY